MKNIRRRVYDALNVLMAMNIIEKEKKEIRWVGLPTSSVQECRKLEEEKAKRQERIRHKSDQLQELIIQVNTFSSRRFFDSCPCGHKNSSLWLFSNSISWLLSALYN